MEGITSYNPSAKSFLDVIHDITKFTFEQIIEKNKKMADYTKKSRIPHRFEVNDQVWQSTKNLSIEDGSEMSKLNPKFCGPFKITEKKSMKLRSGLAYQNRRKSDKSTMCFTAPIETVCNR